LLNFSSMSSQSWLGRMLKQFLQRLIPRDAVLPIIHGPARGMKWLVSSSVYSCWLGSYEFKQQQTILKYLKPGMVAFDIGAHVGFYTLMFSKIVGLSGKVYAFEPLPDNYRILQKHLNLNSITNVITEPVAVSNKDDEVLFYISHNTYMGNIVNNTEEIMKSIYVYSISIDQYIDIKNKNYPNFVKMDVEGAEALALTGMKKLLQAKKPILFISLHNKEVAKECAMLLKGYNYTMLDLEGKSIDIHKVNAGEIIAL